MAFKTDGWQVYKLRFGERDAIHETIRGVGDVSMIKCNGVVLTTLLHH